MNMDSKPIPASLDAAIRDYVEKKIGDKVYTILIRGTADHPHVVVTLKHELRVITFHLDQIVG
jgi:hypothetical protein